MNINVLEWIGELTAAGYDIIAMDGHTMRDGKRGGNMPMPSMVFHLRNGKLDFVIKAYATHSRRWYVYGTGFTGKASNRYFGMSVTGTKEHPVADIDELNKFLGN